MTTHEFDTFARDDRINRARWLSGLMFETSTDRLKAFVETLDLLERETAPRETRRSQTDGNSVPPSWDGALVVVDRGRDYWDRQPDGTYRMRASDLVRTAAQIESAYGPVKPISFPAEGVAS